MLTVLIYIKNRTGLLFKREKGLVNFRRKISVRIHVLTKLDLLRSSLSMFLNEWNAIRYSPKVLHICIGPLLVLFFVRTLFASPILALTKVTEHCVPLILLMVYEELCRVFLYPVKMVRIN